MGAHETIYIFFVGWTLTLIAAHRCTDSFSQLFRGNYWNWEEILAETNEKSQLLFCLFFFSLYCLTPFSKISIFTSSSEYSTASRHLLDNPLWLIVWADDSSTSLAGVKASRQRCVLVWDESATQFLSLTCDALCLQLHVRPPLLLPLPFAPYHCPWSPPISTLHPHTHMHPPPLIPSPPSTPHPLGRQQNRNWLVARLKNRRPVVMATPTMSCCLV